MAHELEGCTLTMHPATGGSVFEVTVTGGARGFMDFKVEDSSGKRWQFQYDDHRRPFHYKRECWPDVYFRGYLIRGRGDNRAIVEVTFRIKPACRA